MVESVSEAFGDYLINFLVEEHNTGGYKFPSKKDACWVVAYNVLQIMTPPTLKPATTIVYMLNKTEVKRSCQMAKSRVKEIKKKIAKASKQKLNK